jgi:hypothetical protein
MSGAMDVRRGVVAVGSGGRPEQCPSDAVAVGTMEVGSGVVAVGALVVGTGGRRSGGLRDRWISGAVAVRRGGCRGDVVAVEVVAIGRAERRTRSGGRQTQWILGAGGGRRSVGRQ